MNIVIERSKKNLGQRAADHGASLLKRALNQNGAANLIVATGASQFDMLAALIKMPGITWNRVTVFHLDEYVGLPITHGASFRKYLWERFVSKLPLPLAEFYYVNGEADPQRECDRLGKLIVSGKF